MPYTYLLAGLIVLIALILILIFNSLVKKRNRTHNAWSDIEVQLKRRYDLIPNLVETVKGYKDLETGILERITLARTDAMTKQNPLAKATAEDALASSLRGLFAVAENYPDLKSSQNFLKLQTQLAEIESDIQSARRYYNATVREINSAIQTFPTNLIAGPLGFSAHEFFSAESEEKTVVPVKFE